jgi:Flp pilus assembly protein TadG
MAGHGRSRLRGERGSAVVDFVLVSTLVVPLFLGILQVGLYLYVRNTVTAAASEGAHYAAVLNRVPADGEARTRELVDGVVKNQLIDSVSAEETDVDGQPGVEVVVRAHMPPLGLWGPGIDFTVDGHAVKETGE